MTLTDKIMILFLVGIIVSGGMLLFGPNDKAIESGICLCVLVFIVGMVDIFGLL